MVSLAEHPDPDEGRKKQAQVPEELDVLGPIVTRPLRSVGSGGAGDPTCARVDTAERPSKRMAQGPSKQVKRACSSSSSSGGCDVSLVIDVAARAVGHAVAEVVEGWQAHLG